MGSEVPLLFQPLVEAAITSNPRVFSIPYEMQRRDILPGVCVERTSHSERRQGVFVPVTLRQDGVTGLGTDRTRKGQNSP